jgi:hypothetical protein
MPSSRSLSSLGVAVPLFLSVDMGQGGAQAREFEGGGEVGKTRDRGDGDE